MVKTTQICAPLIQSLTQYRDFRIVKGHPIVSCYDGRRYFKIDTLMKLTICTSVVPPYNCSLNPQNTTGCVQNSS